VTWCVVCDLMWCGWVGGWVGGCTGGSPCLVQGRFGRIGLSVCRRCWQMQGSGSWGEVGDWSGAGVETGTYPGRCSWQNCKGYSSFRSLFARPCGALVVLSTCSDVITLSQPMLCSVDVCLLLW
jgi:hypothetical protein